MIDRTPYRRNRAYLLGLGSDADRAAVEDALFSDPEAHDELLTLESDLAEEYVTGALRGDERTAFERRLEVDARLRHTVEVVRGLARRSQGAKHARPSRARSWSARLVWAIASMAAMVAVIPLLPSLRASRDEFRAKGGAEAVLRPHCHPACQLGATMSFEVQAPSGHPYWAAFGVRPDGRIVWYEPAADVQTERAPSKVAFWPRTFSLGDATHRAGRHAVHAVFVARPMTRRAIAEAVGEDFTGSEGVVLLRRELQIRKKP